MTQTGESELIYIKQNRIPRDVRNSKSGKKTSSGEICLSNGTLKVGQDQVSGGVSVLCWYAASVANVLWKPFAIKEKVKFGNKVQISNRVKNCCNDWSMMGVTVDGHHPECRVTIGREHITYNKNKHSFCKRSRYEKGHFRHCPGHCCFCYILLNYVIFEQKLVFQVDISSFLHFGAKTTNNNEKTPISEKIQYFLHCNIKI